MARNDVDSRAAKLVELELEREAEQEDRRREQEEATRLTDARERIRRHDREREREQARKQAASEASELSFELGEKADKLQADAEALRSSIQGYADLRARLEDAHSRSGRPVGSDYSTSTRPVLSGWFRSMFGGHNSLVDVQGERVGSIDLGFRSLADRDNLASARPDTQEAS